MHPPKLAKADPLLNVPLLAWIAAAIMAALLTLSFWTPIGWMVDRWIMKDSYYSHGFLVPVVVLYIVWKKRGQLFALRPEVSWLGFAVMMSGLLVLLVSGWVVVYFTAAFGMILVVWGLCGFLFGLPVMRKLAFPAFVLLFMVPLPLQVIAQISLRMKLLVTEIATRVIDLAGIAIVSSGSTIYLGDATVIVGNACSGLSSLISLLFLGIVVAYLSELTIGRRVILLLASVPIAVVSNVFRVMLLALIAYRWGNKSIEGTIHDISGYAVFGVAFLLLYGVMRLLQWRQPIAAEEAAGPPPPPSPGAPVPVAAGKGERHA